MAHCESSSARLACEILARLPRDASPFDAPGWRGLSWRVSGVSRSRGCDVSVLGTGPAGPAYMPHLVLGDGLPALAGKLSSDVSPCGPWLDTTGLLRLLQSEPRPGPPPEGAVAVAEAFAEAVEARTLLALHESGVADGRALRWTLGAGDAPANAAFLAAHPWLAGTVLSGDAHHDPRPSLALGADADAEAARIVAHPSPATPPVLAATRRLRGLAWWASSAVAPREMPDAAMAMAGLPEHLWPPGADGDHGDSDAQQALLGFLHLAPAVATLSALSGRAPASILGSAPDMARYVESLSARAGHELCKEDLCGEWAAFAVDGPLSQVNDMAHAMRDELVRPALLRAGLSVPPSPGHRRPIQAAEPGSAIGRSLRLLLGGRTLPALCELSRRWHARSDAIARIVATLTGDTAPSMPLLFPDLDLGDGVYARHLTTPTELLDEGAPGRDAHGVAGLDHCVASYAEDVLRGACVIVSVRRRTEAGDERLSTAELRPYVGGGGPGLDLVQHRGRGNAEPPDAALALEDALGGINAACDLSLLPDPSAPGPDMTAALAAEGAWERLRDAWSFALPRPLRSATPSEFLGATAT